MRTTIVRYAAAAVMFVGAIPSARAAELGTATTKPSVAPASPPSSTQPSDGDRRSNIVRRPEGNLRRGMEWRRGLGSTPGSGAGQLPPMTDEEKTEIEQFMKSYSPRRWEKFQDVPEDRKDKILSNIRAQYRWMKRLKDEDAEIYDIRIKRLPIEDEMFALGWEMRQESRATEATRKKLKDQVRLFVDNSLAERRVRLARWQDRLKQEQQWLAEQQSSLQQDLARHDMLVDKGVDAIENDRGITELRDLAGPLLQRGFRPSTENTQPQPPPNAAAPSSVDQ